MRQKECEYIYIHIHIAKNEFVILKSQLLFLLRQLSHKKHQHLIGGGVMITMTATRTIRSAATTITVMPR
jgi:hypothetical protein